MNKEWFVKEVSKAKLVDRLDGKKVTKQWLYWTEWQGYPEDSSWEPADSFSKPRHMVTSFWNRADRQNRDFKKMSQFHVGEVIGLKPKEPEPQESRRKPGPGRSSAGLLSGTRVFAPFGDGYFYSSVVQRRVRDKYVVKFDDDNSQATVPLTELRACADLRAADRVILPEEVVYIARMKKNGAYEVKNTLELPEMKLAAGDIKEHWGDRMLSHKDIVCAKRWR
ncbi:hypothetical protein GGX14DRAFT_482557 [Mycena pura]|uniref:Chromo domain-containing protein n=1 Tax=Mycena pura TaxID=153505 RepID=A0AAD6URY3_9AGAR|nr:hypothetical protein GGX14DRAFT_482557 [Mycena pura]